MHSVIWLSVLALFGRLTGGLFIYGSRREKERERERERGGGRGEYNFIKQITHVTQSLLVKTGLPLYGESGVSYITIPSHFHVSNQL
jgi:hypothetical protein